MLIYWTLSKFVSHIYGHTSQRHKDKRMALRGLHVFLVQVFGIFLAIYSNSVSLHSYLGLCFFHIIVFIVVLFKNRFEIIFKQTQCA